MSDMWTVVVSVGHTIKATSEERDLRAVTGLSQVFDIGSGLCVAMAGQDVGTLKALQSSDPELHTGRKNRIMTGLLATGYSLYGMAYVMKRGKGGAGRVAPGLDPLDADEAFMVAELLSRALRDDFFREDPNEGAWKLVFVEVLRPGCGFAYFAREILSPVNFIGWDKTPATVYATPPSTALAPMVVPFMHAGLHLHESLHLLKNAEGATVNDVNTRRLPWLADRDDTPVVRGQATPVEFIETVLKAGGTVFTRARGGTLLGADNNEDDNNQGENHD